MGEECSSEARRSAAPRRAYTIEEMPDEHLELIERALREAEEAGQPSSSLERAKDR